MLTAHCCVFSSFENLNIGGGMQGPAAQPLFYNAMVRCLDKFPSTKDLNSVAQCCRCISQQLYGN